MLVHDARPGPGEPRTPGLHALIVGVSHYRHLPGGDGETTEVAGLDELKQLPTSARTAADMAAWLIEQGAAGTLEVPLQTVRLLLSPSAGEMEQPAGLPAGFLAAEPATYENICREANAWRADARRQRKGMTLFFFSGHGVGGTLDDPILLPADFADPAAASLLDRIVSHGDLSQGMRPPKSPLETVAQRQVYFLDSCRNRMHAFEAVDWTSLPTIWEGALTPGEDDRLLALFMATVPGQRAFAGEAGERTLFGQALMECLQGAAAKEDLADDGYRWRVGTASISDYLQAQMDQRNSLLRTPQQFRTGECMPVPLVAFRAAPRVKVWLSVQPPERGPQVAVTLRDRLDPPAQTVVTAVDPNPMELDLPMSIYRVEVAGAPRPPVELRPLRRQLAIDD